MLVKEQRGIKMPHFGIIWHLLQERFPSYCKICVSPDSWKHASKKHSILVLDTNKLFKFDFDRQLNIVKKLEPNCLPCLSNCKIEITTVQLLFPLFRIQQVRTCLHRVELKLTFCNWALLTQGKKLPHVCPFEMSTLDLGRVDKSTCPTGRVEFAEKKRCSFLLRSEFPSILD